MANSLYRLYLHMRTWTFTRVYTEQDKQDQLWTRRNIASGTWTCSTSGIFLCIHTTLVHKYTLFFTMQAACLTPDEPGSVSGLCRQRHLPLVPSSVHGSKSMCAQAYVYKHTVFACIWMCVWVCGCVPGGGSVASNATQRGHHLSLIGPKAGALNLLYSAAPMKTKRRHFLPIFLMNIKDRGSAATTTHKEKLQPIILFALPVIGSILLYLLPYQHRLGCKHLLIY